MSIELSCLTPALVGTKIEGGSASYSLHQPLTELEFELFHATYKLHCLSNRWTGCVIQIKTGPFWPEHSFTKQNQLDDIKPINCIKQSELDQDNSGTILGTNI